MSQHTYAPDVESIQTGSHSGLPDSPELEMQLAAEMTELGFDEQPSDDDIERMAEYHHARQSIDNGGQGDDGPRPTSPAGAMFPEVTTWPDDHLTVALGMADARDPGLNLHAVGNVPDRHEAFIAEVSAEIVRRLDVRKAA